MLPVLKFGSITIPIWLTWVSLVATFLLWWWRYRLEAWGLERKLGFDLALVILVSMFVGGRLAHVFWEAPQFYAQNPALVLEIWRGGFVFFGGLLLSLAAGALFLLWKKQPILLWADALAAPLAAGYALGRVGCFLNGCCYGSFCPWPWGITFPIHGEWGILPVPRHPTQLYAAGWETLVLIGLWLSEKRRHQAPEGLWPNGLFFFTWLKLHALGRLMMEVFRDDERGPMLLNLSASAWLAIVLLIAATASLKVIQDRFATRSQFETSND